MDEALAGLEPGLDPVRCLAQLRRVFPPELAREGARLHSLRERCKSRLGKDLLPFLRDPGHQQVSAPRIAEHRAARISALTPHSHIWDSTCGLGMESLHLGLAGHGVVSTDLDAETLQFAAANLRHHGLRPWTVRANALESGIRAPHVLIDPDRRPGGFRTLNPDAWSPTLSQTLALLARHQAGVAKLPPGMDVPGDWDRTYALHWISLEGQLLECTLWTGAWAPSPGRTAVLLGKDGRHFEFTDSPQSTTALTAEGARSISFLADPDPSIVRAGLLGRLAAGQGLQPLAEKLGYLGGEHPPTSHFLTGYRVLASCALDRKKVRRMLAEHDVGPIQVRMRGHDEPAETLERKLKGPGRHRGMLAIARLDGGRWVYLIEPEPRPSDPD
ncbi:MAG: hypothetical protein KDB61_01985 [Planctomycetes bacterium]|nr:hypothetical protein [Planctomycetota bacterium]